MQRLNATKNLATLNVVWPALSGPLYLLHNQILWEALSSFDLWYFKKGNCYNIYFFFF